MDKALLAGIQEFEIYEQRSSSTSITVYQQNVDTFTVSDCDGVSLRGLYHGKMGICFLEDLDDEQVDTVLQQIIQNAQTITSNDEVAIQKGQESYPIIDRKKNICLDESSDVKVKLLMELEQKILEKDERIAQVMSTSYSEVEVMRCIDNSKGMHIFDENSYSCIVAQVLVRDQEEVKNDYDWQLFQDIKDVDINAFADELVKKVISKLHGSSMKRGTYPILIQNDTMADLFGALCDMFDGEDAFKGVSILKDKLGEQIFDKRIQVIDDPLMKDGMNSASFDDEGTACFKKALVEDGVLKTYLHNTKSAKMMKTTTTGNGFKAGYASDVLILPTNLYIENGTSSFDELLKEMNTGIIINELSGLHAGLNPISMDFSIQSEGFYVEDGKIVHPVNLITIAGNFMDMMKHIRAIGNDGKANISGVICPSILFEGLTVSGE